MDMTFKSVEVKPGTTDAPPGALKSVTIDCTLFGFEEGVLKILLVKRDIEPQKGLWALPGGWIDQHEDLDDAARRILEEATGVADVYLEQVHCFGRVGRFPIERIITVSYMALVRPEHYTLRHGPNNSGIRWCNIDEVPALTFDHNEILRRSLKYLRDRVRQVPIGFELLPEKFTLSGLQRLYEAILGTPLNKRNFRKKLLKMELLHEHNEWQTEVSHRPAKLYSFERDRYYELKAKGFVYDL